MKKSFVLVLVLAIASGLVFFSGCKKDDTTAPVITLIGGATVYIDLGQAWVDPGFTAEDDEDGDITAQVVVTGTVDNKVVNEYMITYTVADDAGNETTIERKVYVRAELLKGTYDVTDVVTGANAGTYTYTVTIDPSSDYNKLLFKNFGGFGATVTVSITISGTNVTIPSQSPPGMPPGFEGTITGFGTYDGNTKEIKNITYTVNYTAGGTDNGVAAYDKL
ncbi:MAG TPA: DUF5011 domain-containing protein [Bacteroidales bacterium]|nr:DUF5011 domain-containing protein [Bacteroidales bacterium]HSA44084.1 DUF5011 domain-containing protein [Bacteroidales bacterium]